jgi:hypothetical protein
MRERPLWDLVTVSSHVRLAKTRGGVNGAAAGGWITTPQVKTCSRPHSNNVARLLSFGLGTAA